jgi:hypothetical protein
MEMITLFKEYTETNIRNILCLCLVCGNDRLRKQIAINNWPICSSGGPCHPNVATPSLKPNVAAGNTPCIGFLWHKIQKLAESK